MNTPYIALAFILCISASYLYGNHSGVSKQKLVQQAEIAQILKRHMSERASLDIKLAELQKAFDQKQVKERIVYQTVTKRIAYYDAQNVGPDMQCFSDTILRIVNDSAAGNTPPTPSGGTDEGVRDIAGIKKRDGEGSARLHTADTPAIQRMRDQATIPI